MASSANGNLLKDKIVDNETLMVSNLYPNPARNFAAFDFEIKDNEAHVEVVIRNIIGSEVGSYSFETTERKLQIAVSHLNSGIYFYTLLVNEKNILTRKFMISR